MWSIVLRFEEEFVLSVYQENGQLLPSHPQAERGLVRYSFPVHEYFPASGTILNR